jgi:hypothetical protein
MACAITSGFALDCKDVVGGIKNLYIAPLSSVTTVAANASGYVTAITKSGLFYKYELMPRGANSFTENIQADPATGSVAYEPTLNVVFSKLSQTNSNKFDLLTKNRMAVIVETKDGSFFLAGQYNGMEVNGGTAASGAAMNEFQGFNLTLGGMEKALSPEVSPAIIAALLV